MKEEVEVCISGIGGRFPGCSNVDQLKESLMNKVNLVADDRWKTDFNVDTKIGGVKDVFNFDLTYFGIYRKHADFMDPGTKKILECSVEAVHDAGLTMDDMSGSRTGVISCSSSCEVQMEIAVSWPKRNYILMYAASMYSNRVSYFFNLTGPSFVCSADWNGGMYIMEHARHLIATGSVNSMIVATSSYAFIPEINFHYEKIGRINPDGNTKSFSDDADGYSRSDSFVVFLLQRKEDALRSYGTILGIGQSVDGSRTVPLTQCSINPDIALSAYKQAGIHPSQISYLEASGSASKAVDAEELNALSKILLEKRKKELPIGSIKSNIGHTEASSSYASLVKLLIASETGLIPPNINYSSPNSRVPALLSGKYKVVTEPTPLEGDFLALNNVSSFGGYAHAIIRRNLKTKKRKCEVNLLPPDKIPRLVLISGRDESLLQKQIEKVENMPIDEEFIALTHKTFGKGIKNHIYRGYTILHEGTKTYTQIEPLQIGYRRPFWMLCSGMGSQWPGMGTSLMKIPIFAKSIQYCHDLLTPHGVDLIDIITNPEPNMFDNILNCFVGITAIQIGLIDVLKAIGIEADGILGHSVGELGCAYLDGTFTAKQTILTSLMRGKVSAQSGISGGRMAAVGRGYKELKEIIPDGIDIACRNSSTSCTISGPAQLVDSFLDTLTSIGIFNRAVASAGIPYHSRYIKDLGATFLDTIKELIPEPKLRSEKWISTSVPKEDWDKDEAKYSSAEYHTNNLLKPVLFEEALELIPSDAIILEIAPRGLLKAIIERALPSATYINLTNTGNEGEFTLLSAFGRLFNAGIKMDLTNLYPPVEFPVSRGTPSLSSLFTWIHDEPFKLWSFFKMEKYALKRKEVYFNNDMDEAGIYSSFANYYFNDIPFIPAAALLDLIINMFIESNTNSKLLVSKFLASTLVKYGDERVVHAALHKEHGSFEITLGDGGLSTGIIEEYIQENSPFYSIKPLHLPEIIFYHEEIYSYLHEKGLSPSSQHKNILQISVNNSFTSACAEIVWKDSLLTFLEAIFTFMTALHSFKNNELLFLNKFENLYLNLDELTYELDTVVKVYYNTNIELLWCDGLELHIPSMVSPAIDSSYLMGLGPSAPVLHSLGICGIESVRRMFEDCLRLIDNEGTGRKDIKKLKIFLLSENISEENVETSIRNLNSKFQVEVASLHDENGLAYIKKQIVSDDISFILNETNDVEITLEILERSHAGFLLSSREITIPNLTCILCRVLGKVTYYFYKSVKQSKSEPKHCEVVLNSPKWETTLQSKLMEKDIEIVYVIGSSHALNYAKMVIQKCSKFDNYFKIRFLFVEKMCPSLDDETIKAHLKKDLKINILKNGEWSTFLYYPVVLSQPFDNHQTQEECIYQFQNIKAKGIQLRALGLNLPSVKSPKEKLTVFEFSGLKNGKEVCGLAKLNETTRHLEIDPEFVWRKPRQWAHEDVVSVLYVYSMAYYILDVLGFEFDDHKITGPYLLVLNGQMPISQACIHLARKRGLKIITTYSHGQNEKKLIQKLFPEISEKDILKLDQSLVENIMVRTNGQGVDRIINTSGHENVSLLADSLSYFRSQLFQFTTKSSEFSKPLGMIVFVRGADVHGVVPDVLFDLGDEFKKRIRTLVEAGFSEDIKPLNKTYISLDSYNIDVLTKLREEICEEKFVVQMNEDVKFSLKSLLFRICNMQKYNIIVGIENEIWHDIIQWLTSRGATKIILAAKSISPVMSKRINILLNNNKFVDIKLCSSESLNTCEGVNKFIKEIKEEGQIETIFIFGKEYYDAFSDIHGKLLDTQIVGIGKDLTMDNGRTSTSPKHVLISVACEDESSLKAISRNLDFLINLSQPVLDFPHTTNISGIKSIYYTFWKHLPVTPEEVGYLGRCADCAGWKEVRTRTLPYSACKEVPPVFIIPPLKRDQIDKLLGNLMYPAFQAIIPEEFDSFQHLALELLKGLSRFEYGVYTLICADWSYHLGLLLASLLEKRGKKLSLILLDISTSWADIKVLDSIYSKVSNSLQAQNNRNLGSIERGFKIMKRRLEHINRSVIPSGFQFQGLCHLFHNGSLHKDDVLQLNQFCSRKVMVHSMMEKDYPDNVNSVEAGKIINASILVEYKDRARPAPDRGYNHFLIKNKDARMT